MARYAAALLFGCWLFGFWLFGVRIGLAAVASPEAERERDSHAVTAASLLANQPNEIRERLQQEKLVLMEEVGDETPAGLMVGLVIFEQPIKRVYDYLAETERQIEVRPELTSIEVVSRGEHHVDEYRMKILFKRYEYRLQYSLDPVAHELRWELAPGFENDLERLDGFWQLYALHADRTLGRFGSRVSVGPGVPRFLQDWMTREKMPDTLENIRRWIDAGGRQ